MREHDVEIDRFGGRVVGIDGGETAGEFAGAEVKGLDHETHERSERFSCVSRSFVTFVIQTLLFPCMLSS